MNEYIALSIAFVVFGFCAFKIGFRLGAIRTVRSTPATPMQRALTSIISGESRTARMHGFQDGCSLAHRTDSGLK